MVASPTPTITPAGMRMYTAKMHKKYILGHPAYYKTERMALLHLLPKCLVAEFPERATNWSCCWVIQKEKQILSFHFVFCISN